jgi:hypothetical protein
MYNSHPLAEEGFNIGIIDLNKVAVPVKSANDAVFASTVIVVL